jgi:uncharacterized Tic20 family protein
MKTILTIALVFSLLVGFLITIGGLAALMTAQGLIAGVGLFIGGIIMILIPIAVSFIEIFLNEIIRQQSMTNEFLSKITRG